MLRMPRGVRHDEVAAPGVPEQIDLVGAEVRAQRVEIGDLVGERADCPVLSAPDRPFPRWS